MSSKRSVLIAGLTSIVAAGLIVIMPAGAVEYVDVDQSAANSYVAIGEYHQAFIPGAFNISAVSVFCGRLTGDQNIQIRDSVCGTVLAQGTFTAEIGWVKCGQHARILIPAGICSSAPGRMMRPFPIRKPPGVR